MPGSSTINVKCSLFAITSVKTELLLYPDLSLLTREFHTLNILWIMCDRLTFMTQMKFLDFLTLTKPYLMWIRAEYYIPTSNSWQQS